MLSPLEKAGLISRLLYTYVTPLIDLGRKKVLTLEDLLALHPDDRATRLVTLVEKEWLATVAAKRPSYIRAIYNAFRAEIWVVILLTAIVDMARISQPLLLRALVASIADPTARKGDGYIFAFLLAFFASFQVLFHHMLFFRSMRLGWQLRTATVGVINSKILRVKSSSLAAVSVGHIVNLVSNDVFKFDAAAPFFAFLLIGPCEVLIISGLLWKEIGAWPTIAGVLITCLLVPMYFFFAKLFVRLRVQTSALTDARVKYTSQIISGIMAVKMYAWETPFAEVVSKSRRAELAKIRFASWLKAVNAGFYFATPALSSFSLFSIFVAQGHLLRPSSLFFVLSLMNVMRLVVGLWFPKGFEGVADIKASAQRIERVMLLPDHLTPEEVAAEKKAASGAVGPTSAMVKAKVQGSASVAVRDGEFSWPGYRERQGYNTLSKINFSAHSGEILAVVGPVGCGKSSLLASLLSDTDRVNGEVDLVGSTSFASQTSFILAGTVRSNICFWRPFEEKWYNEVTKACALTDDFRQFPNGDQTEIGERGINLSGGQKARLGLARAVYANADVIILDDVLSAVDPKVSRHLFDRCLNGILAPKLRILVTHQVQYLHQVDKVLVLNSRGEQVAFGTHDQVKQVLVKDAFLDLDENVGGSEGASPPRLIALPPHGKQGKEAHAARRAPTPDASDDSSSLSSASSSLSSSSSVSVSSALSSAPSDLSSASLSSSVALTVQEKGAPGPLTLASGSVAGPAMSSSSTTSGTSDGSNGSDDSESDSATSSRTPRQRLPLLADDSTDSTWDANSTGSLSESTVHAASASKLVQAEQQQSGGLSWDTWREYIVAAGPAWVFVLMIFIATGQIMVLVSDWWLAHWARQSAAEQTKKYYIWSLFLLALSTIFFSMTRSALHFVLSLRISQKLHDRMFSKILRSPMLFFHSNPTGRILNRFSKDISFLDELLPFTMFDAIATTFMVLGAICIMAYGVVWILIVVVPLLAYLWWIRTRYVSSAREIKRIDAVNRSPLYAQFSATLQGLPTIRAFNVERNFNTEFQAKLDTNGLGFFNFLLCARWVGIRVDCISAALLTVCAFAAVISKGHISPSLVGLALAYSLQLAGLFQWCVRQSAEVESQMTSVERVVEYTRLPSEAPAIVQNAAVAPEWPSKGGISFRKLTMRYRADLDPVLNEVSLEVQPREKVGIVGRTGAGKSSILNSLFRLVEASAGSLVIDGVDISTVGLHTLRSALSIIPQDPIIFSGTLRYNLDPFSRSTDDELWRVLEIVQLKATVATMVKKLETEMTEDGGNLSAGQRQLVCLARAILRRPRILVMDEATANVDMDTDAIIQETIRKEFNESTVIVIAHRLATVVDMDKILVLERGKVVEFDTPKNLLAKAGLFASMIEETGPESAKTLRALAK